MNRLLPIFAGLLLIAAAAGAWWMMQDGPAPSVDPGEVVETPAAPADEEVEPAAADSAAEPALEARVADAVEAAPAAATGENPIPESYRRALSRIVGRVVEEDGAPVVGVPVKLLQLHVSVDQIVFGGLAGLGRDDPALVALGGAETDAEGRFEIDGAVPTALGALGIDLGGARATLRAFDYALHSAKVTDIGDFVLSPFVTFVGRVADESDQPISGARVRCTDLPAIVFQSGAQHFHSDSQILVLEKSERAVVELPQWILDLERQLPLPTAFSAADGTFRLEGAPVGLVATIVDADGFVTSVKPNQPSGRGEKNIGTLTLTRGQTAAGRVVDAAGNPVANAEVLAGAVSPLGPVAISGPAVFTDRDGRFSAPTVPDGEVAFAARPASGTPWRLFDEVTDPAAATLELGDLGTLTVRFVDANGSPIESVDATIRALPPGFLAQMAPWVGPSGTVDRVPSPVLGGATSVSGLPFGVYEVSAEAEGFAPGKVAITVGEEGGDGEVVLHAGVTFQVTVVDNASGEPLEHAEVKLRSADRSNQFFARNIDLTSGRTDADGSVTLGPNSPPADSELHLDAVYPGYAPTVLPNPEPGQRSEIRLTPGGEMQGLVHSSGRALDIPLMIVAVCQSNGRFMEVPRFTVTAPDGTFRLSGLAAGEYEVEVWERFLSVDPTGLIERAMADNEPDEFAAVECEVQAGQITELQIDVSGAVDGATASLMGSVRLNGAPVEGASIRTRGKRNRQNAQAETDGQGRFRIDDVGAGTLRVTVTAPREGNELTLLQDSVTLTADELGRLDVDVRSLAAPIEVSSENGEPIENAQISAYPRRNETSMLSYASGDHGQTGADGRFELTLLQAGNYQITVHHSDYSMFQGELKVPESGLKSAHQITLTTGCPFNGTVTLQGFASDARNVTSFVMAAPAATPEHAVAFAQVEEDGKFDLRSLAAGRYTVTVMSGNQRSLPIIIDLPRGGLEGYSLIATVSQ